ncbi:MAG: RNA polymerase sigma factor RpoD/SigA [Acidimicrobiia bacterium]
MVARRGGSAGDGDAMRQYLDEIGAHTLLSGPDEVRLGNVMAEGREAAERLATFGAMDERDRRKLQRLVDAGEGARDEFIKANLRLVVSVARRYQGNGLAMADLVQEGNIGLMRAVDKFDPNRGFKFSTYATWWIRQSIGRAIAESSRSIKVPAHVRESAPLVMKAMEKLGAVHDRRPTSAEVAADTGLTAERVELVLIHRADVVSLSTPVMEDDAELGDQLEDPTLETPFEVVLSHLERERLFKSLNRLNERERDVLRLRFGLDRGEEQTLAEIGDLFKLTRERIRQIEAKALTKLRHPCISGMRPTARTTA